MNLLNTLIDNLDEALIILDREGKIVLFNEAAVELNKNLFVKPFAEGEDFVNALDLESRLAMDSILESVQEKKTSEKYFTEIKNHRGVQVSLEFNFVPVLNEAGERTHVHLLIRDITSQKVFERKLITQAANFSSLIERANAIIIGLDTRGYITDWNDHCAKVTGFEKGDAFAQKLVTVLMKEVEPRRFEELFLKAMSDQPVISEELMIRTKGGKLITLLLSCSHRLSVSGQVVGLTLVGQDMTELTEYRMALEMKVEERTRELKQALQKQKEAVEIKSRFVSIASHEFRSPLSSIQFQTNFIKEQGSGLASEDLQRRIGAIEKHAHHMSMLLNDVLNYEKTETNKIRLDLTDIDLREFLNRVVEEVSHQKRSETDIVRAEFSQLPMKVVSEEKLLRSVIVNLLTNAIKFSPDKDHVFLTVKGLGNQLIVMVRDEGIGIPPDELERIFEPFLRGKGVGSIQGTGLGLSIVKKSVDLLGGTIHVTSEVGKGSTFTVTVPI
ncbi:MAG TPA: PAS domain-containing sensor histidine kinase [Cyclobacteriaceae bacterium]|nr:PAS domain-containing sensor histidine kinase [Cyclobacteriaceae bacterium]